MGVGGLPAPPRLHPPPLCCSGGRSLRPPDLRTRQRPELTWILNEPLSHMLDPSSLHKERPASGDATLPAQSSEPVPPWGAWAPVRGSGAASGAQGWLLPSVSRTYRRPGSRGRGAFGRRAFAPSGCDQVHGWARRPGAGNSSPLSGDGERSARREDTHTPTLAGPAGATGGRVAVRLPGCVLGSPMYTGRSVSGFHTATLPDGGAG